MSLIWTAEDDDKYGSAVDRLYEIWVDTSECFAPPTMTKDAGVE